MTLIRLNHFSKCKGRQTDVMLVRWADEHKIAVVMPAGSDGASVIRHYVDGDGHSWNFWDGTLRLALRELLPISHHTIML